jgi:hypothetical protein
MNIKSIVMGIAGGLSVALAANSAHAFIYHYCNDTNSKWESNSAGYQIMRYSIPSGSQRDIDVVYSFNEWNAVYGMYDVFSWSSGTADPVSIDHDNGVNQIYYGTNAGMDGALGVTYVRYSSSCFWWFDDQWIVEADVAINGEFAFEWGNPACDTYSTGNRTTIIHEMGHALGLEHDDSHMNLMMTSDGEGKYCGTHTISPHPDDAEGGRFLYGSGNTSHDLGASEFRLIGSNNVDRNTSPGTTYLCPGNSYTFRWSVGNMGNVGDGYQVDWYLSTNNIISTSDIFVARNTGAFESANGFDTWTKTVTIPTNVTYGTTYYFGTLVDSNNAVAERYEDNNGTYMARRIAIKARSQCP